jgi:hypothetical protein
MGRCCTVGVYNETTEIYFLSNILVNVASCYQIAGILELWLETRDVRE